MLMKEVKVEPSATQLSKGAKVLKAQLAPFVFKILSAKEQRQVVAAVYSAMVGKPHNR